MNIRNVRTTFLLLIAGFCSLAHAAIPLTERNVLLNFYTSTNGASWTNHTGWNGASGTECSWFGITCDGSSSHVTNISLGINNLSGSLPALDGLTSLSVLYVNSNQLTGSIPPLTGLTGLTEVEAYGNHFTGSIPLLTGLTNLIIFDVDTNQLTGSIPPLTGLTNLLGFVAYSNQLTGSLPSLAGLTNLNTFIVRSNQLTGSIPALTIGMNNFDVGSNQLTGSLPSLAGLGTLNYFRVGGNHLSGSLPTAPGTLTAGGSSLCANDFPESSYVDNSAWDTATGVALWYTPCNKIFANGFQ